MSRSVLLGRSSLSLADLQLWDPPNLIVAGDSFGPGPQTLRRTTISSPFVRGRFPIDVVADTQDAPMTLQVLGSTGADLSSRVGVVLAAFSQWSYTLAYNFDGIIGSWQCEAADYTVGEAGRFEDIDTVFHAVQILLTIPHDPLPLTGVI